MPFQVCCPHPAASVLPLPSGGAGSVRGAAPQGTLPACAGLLCWTACPSHGPALGFGRQRSRPSPQLFKALSSFAKSPVLLGLSRCSQPLLCAGIAILPLQGSYTQEEKAKHYRACGSPSRATHSLQKDGRRGIKPQPSPSQSILPQPAGSGLSW